MKFVLQKYQIISVTLSLLILCAGFTAASDQEKRGICFLLALLFGILLYAIGSIRAGSLKRLPVCVIEGCMSLGLLAAAVLVLLRMGGIL
ncbi:MAG TPA: hypothetical protein DD414_07520 [Lachnospiraceae bacterium]|nr:hypothetical protein [Lachnospiraceae bacterium]